MASISRVGVVAKSRLQVAAPHLIDVENWLASRGVEAIFETATAALMPASTTRRVAEKQSLVNEVGLVLVLGGDGTLLSMADAVGRTRLDVPILGVNFGSLGFLTEVTLPELYPALEAALAGRAHIEERLTLRATIERPAGSTCSTSSEVAVNDVVINKGARSRLIDLSIWVGDGLVTTVRADGLIVATPTGSTAYNLAAGGPIVQPNVEALVLTPIAPHTLTNRPIVIPSSATVHVKPMMDERDEVFVTFDGQAGCELHAGDEISVCRSSEPMRLIRPATRSYFEVLREKLNWGKR